MPISELYIAPDLISGGSGTIGDPYGNLESAIIAETFDLTNGTRVNIKAGTDEILAADLTTALADTSVSIAWAPGPTKPLVFQGYTAIAGDGGIGGISGGGSVSVFDNSSSSTTHFIDLHCHTTGTQAYIIRMGSVNTVKNCELNGNIGGCVFINGSGGVYGSYVHDFTAVGIRAVRGWVVGNWVEDFTGINVNTQGIEGTVEVAIVRNVVIPTSGAIVGIQSNGATYVSENSIYGGGSGNGRGIDTGNSAVAGLITNNLVEGFGGANGYGIKLSGSTASVILTGANAVYDCTTPYDTPRIINDLGDNETLTASPFRDAANGDFRPRNVGHVIHGALPAGYHANAPSNIIQMHKGAIQPGMGLRPFRGLAA